MSHRRRIAGGIPITSDMVSLWIPSGTSRAKDIIRGNDGQVVGAYPSIPAISGSINPSLGWGFDGVDDEIDCGDTNEIEGIDSLSIGCWVWAKEDIVSYSGLIVKALSADSSNYSFVLSQKSTNVSFGARTASVASASSSGLDIRNKWYFITGVYNGATVKIYVDSVEKASDNQTGNINDTTNSVIIGKFTEAESDNYNRAFNGYIALPFMANSAWSIAKIANFYRQTKGLFSPRG